MLHRTCAFASSWIYRSRTAFGCLWYAKRQRTFFILGWDEIRFDKKRAWTRYAEHVILHLVGFVGHVVHSSASGAQNIDALFLMLGWDRYGYVTPNLCFYIWWDISVMLCIPLLPRCETLMHYFSCLGGTDLVQ
jgi:hypothetical protein